MSPTADVSVRIAWADDAPAIAALQLRTWREVYADLLPAEALPDDVDAAAAVWQASLSRPRDARNRVLVALERNRVVGFAITSPASDPDCDPVADGELSEVTIDPTERGQGHGSRLLQAAVDTLVADRFERAVLWSMASDDALRKFLTEAGWARRRRPPRARPRRRRDDPRQAGPAPHRAHRFKALDFLGTTVTMETHSTSGVVVFGPLPQLYRILVIVTALVVGVLSGVWLAQLVAGPAAIAAGIGWGLLAGLVLNYVLLHDFEHRARPARVRRH